MSLEFNKNLHPPLGHVFKNTDGTKFRGRNWEELTAKVTEYRTVNGFPVGDVMAEIIAQVCKSSPSFCRDSSVPRKPSQTPRVRPPDAPRPQVAVPKGKGNMVARVTNWIHSLIAAKRKGAISFVSKSEGKRRRTICASCPKLTSVSGSCGGCMTALSQAKGVVLAGNADVEKPIAGCKVLGEDVSVSAYIVLAPNPDPSLPANCWRRQN